ncbi:MAG: ABC transporter ATP-binding protein [Clostridia bacterium]|nr:ABC transporter ATP-binding protein [Clostridia bacterium]
MKNLFHYLKSYTLEAILGPLFKLLEAMFELFVPLVVADIIDRGIAAGDKSYIIGRSLILVALGVIGLVCSLTAQYFAARAAVGTSCSIRRSLYEHIQKLSFSDIDRAGIPTLITRLTGDVNQVQNGINLALRLLLRSPFVVFGAMIMAFTLDAKAALIFLAVIAVLSVIVFGIILGSVPAYKKVQSELDALTGTTRESLSGARVIRAFGMEDSESETFAKHNTSLKQRQQFAGKISALMNPMTFVILNLGIIALLQSGGNRVMTGALLTGEVVALYNYMTQILVELVKFANLIITITKAITCMQRIDAVIHTEPEMTFPETIPAETASAPAIEFRSVSVQYTEGSDPALSDVSFRIERGQTVGIIGGTGCGKSTLVSLIPRFYDVSAGEILVNGVNVREYPADKLRDKVGYVLQKALLFKGTIRSNLLYGTASATDADMTEAIAFAQGSDVLAAKENGLDSVVEQGGRNFSGGQRQRLTIARALVRKPEILILDDSASALDFATDAALRRTIRSLPERPTTLIVSQRTASIMDADQIIVLDDGKVVGIGTHSRLLETCDVYREIYESQYNTGNKSRQEA